LQFMSDARRNTPRRDAARLRVADQPADSAAHFEANLGKLGGFSRAGLAAKDDHLILFNRLRDLLALLNDRQPQIKPRTRNMR